MMSYSYELLGFLWGFGKGSTVSFGFSISKFFRENYNKEYYNLLS